jgi:hypothetical protein
MTAPGIRGRLRGSGACWANARRRGPEAVRRDAYERLSDMIYLAWQDGVSLEAIATDTGLPAAEVARLLRGRLTPTTTTGPRPP